MKQKFFQLNTSYSQLAIFCAQLAQPFNNWSERHVRQGFSWRPGSVSFRTLFESGTHDIDVHLGTKGKSELANCIRAIEVPFMVPHDQLIVVASISDEFSIEVPEGAYALRYLAFSNNNENLPRLSIEFLSQQHSTFQILRQDQDLTVAGELLLDAEPAD